LPTLAPAFHDPTYAFPFILLLSFIGCIVGTLMTKPVDEEILKNFYRNVRPWGFWKPVYDKIAAEDPSIVRNGIPGAATELMVAYAYDTIARGNPVAFFGMVLVLEGTSVALALHAADRIQACLDLPDGAFTYLRSHGVLDREHTHHLAALLDRVDDPSDQAAVVHAARMFYRLYGDIFRSLPLPSPVSAEDAIP